MARRLITTLTPSTPTASYTYTGTGAGKVDFVVEIEDDNGTVVSQPSTVTDCLFYDEATSNAKASQYGNSDPSNLQVSYDNATILQCSQTSGTRQYQTKINDTLDWKDSNTNYQIELDYEFEYINDGTCSVVFGNARIGLGILNNGATSGSGHITIISDGDTYIIKNNGTQYGSTQSMTNDNGFRFYIYRSGILKFKNLEIYPI